MLLEEVAAGERQDTRGIESRSKWESDPSNVSRWVSESRDPAAEATYEIKTALEKLEPAAAEEFVTLYLYDSPNDD